MIDFRYDASELKARRRRMFLDGYRECDMPACNCGSWHRPPSKFEERPTDLVKVLLDGDPSRGAADGVMVLDVWRREIEDLLGRYNR